MQSSAGHETFQLAPHSKRPSERPQGQDCTVRHTLPKGRAINETRPLLQKFFAALTAVPAAGPKTALSPPHAVAEECTMPPRHSTPDVLPKHRQGSTKSPQFPNAKPQSPTRSQSAKRPYRWLHVELTAIVWRAKAKRFPFACPNVRWNVLDVFASVAAFAPLATLVSCWPRINR